MSPLVVGPSSAQQSREPHSKDSTGRRGTFRPFSSKTSKKSKKGSARHKAPGVYVDPQETAGLPGHRDAHQAAARIVRTHATGGHGNVRCPPSPTIPEQDAENQAVPINPPLLFGGSILGALLGLYQRGQAPVSPASHGFIITNANGPRGIPARHRNSFDSVASTIRGDDTDEKRALLHKDSRTTLTSPCPDDSDGILPKLQKWQPGYIEPDRWKQQLEMQAYIARHLAEVAVRQEFILKLARAMMMFGAPSHRLRRQVIDAGYMLDLTVSAMHFPETMFISFEDATTATSSVRFLRQASTMDLGRLADAYELYWRATHNELCVADASKQLSDLMQRKHIYPWWFIMLCGGISASAMCGASFYGSFLDTVVVFPLGAAVIGIQYATAGHELFTNVQEIIIAAAFSFLSACLASTGKICYSAVTSSSVALVLPGMVALHGGLELMSRNLISGSVRLVYAVIYAIFVAFGLFVGAEMFELIAEKPVYGLEDYYCSSVHTTEGLWWQRSSGVWWSFLTVPLVSLTLALCRYYPYKQWKELILIVFISCCGYTVSHLVEVTKFSGQGDVSAGVGAFAVGLIANLYGELFDGNAFVVMVVGISYLVPSAFGPNGLLAFVSLQSSGVAYAYVGAFSVGLRMVTVSIGLTVGLGLALLITHPIPSGVKDGGVFSM